MTNAGHTGRRWTLLMWGGAAVLLAAPLAAMQVSDAMNWTAFDFGLLAVLLGGLCLGVEIAVRRGGSLAYRLGAALALGAAVGLILINGAVGVIGSEQEDANLLFGAVLVVALLGALIARFRASGMAGAMIATAAAQALVPVAAWLIWPATQALLLTPQVLGITAGFAVLWLASAWQFRRAA